MDQNLREQVVQHVRAEIISGQSTPGTMYSVPGLVEDLGVSTTPVREALLELARNGLIEPVRNRGFKVLEPLMSSWSFLRCANFLKYVPPSFSLFAHPESWMIWSGSQTTLGVPSRRTM